MQKQTEALARYYVTSYWQAEWVKKRRWKTTELPSHCFALSFKMFVCLHNHSDIIIEIKVHGVLLLFHFVSVLSITNHEKQEKIEYTTKHQNEQFSQLTNSKNLVKHDAVTPARTNQSALAEITN